MGVVLHKDSKWYQQWKDFKDNNVVFNSKKLTVDFADYLHHHTALYVVYVSTACIRLSISFPTLLHNSLLLSFTFIFFIPHIV